METTTDYNSDWLYGKYGQELTEWERGELSDAAAGMFHRGGMLCQGLARFNLYRRRGIDTTAALAYALTWCRNSIEQHERRLSHDTGAEGWRERSPGQDRVSVVG